MNKFHSLNQIDSGELIKQIEMAIETCIKDINNDTEVNKKKRCVDIKIFFVPDFDKGNVEICYDVISKLAKRDGQMTSCIGKDGNLYILDDLAGAS